MMNTLNLSARRAFTFGALAIAVISYPELVRAQDTQPPAGEPGATPTPDQPAPAPAPAQPAAAPAAPTEAQQAAPAAKPEEHNAAGAPAAGQAPSVEATPVTAPPRQRPDQSQPRSWFYRAPLTLDVGTDGEHWGITFYGSLSADLIHDDTRSFNEKIGSNVVQRRETFEGRSGRTQFSSRSTKIGLKLESPELGGVRPSAVVVFGFGGESTETTTPPQISEGSYYSSPQVAMQSAYLSLGSDYVDVLVGLTNDLFGWQSYYAPCSIQSLGLPNEAHSRHTQVRISHTFGVESPFGVGIGIAASRPAQRDSEVPDGQGGLQLNLNSWKGITTPGALGTVALPLSIGVSGIVRRFKVNAFTFPPVQNANEATGWGVSLDALVPVIPADNADDRGNKLTLTGSFTTGTGIADMITAGGGARFPTLPNPAQANPPPIYTPDIDNGLVTFDTLGVLHTIDWQTFMVGLQYYLPPTGRLIFSANYTEGFSMNMADLYPQGGIEIELQGRVAKRQRYADANLLFDVTPAIRAGISLQWVQTTYVDGDKPDNLREMVKLAYVF